MSVGLLKLVRNVSGVLAAIWLLPGSCVSLLTIAVVDRGVRSFWTDPTFQFCVAGEVALLIVYVSSTTLLKRLLNE